VVTQLDRVSMDSLGRLDEPARGTTTRSAEAASAARSWPAASKLRHRLGVDRVLGAAERDDVERFSACWAGELSVVVSAPRQLRGSVLVCGSWWTPFMVMSTAEPLLARLTTDSLAMELALRSRGQHFGQHLLASGSLDMTRSFVGTLSRSRR
jgi:hypothetical protein